MGRWNPIFWSCTKTSAKKNQDASLKEVEILCHDMAEFFFARMIEPEYAAQVQALESLVAAGHQNKLNSHGNIDINTSVESGEDTLARGKSADFMDLIICQMLLVSMGLEFSGLPGTLPVDVNSGERDLNLDQRTILNEMKRSFDRLQKLTKNHAFKLEQQVKDKVEQEINEKNLNEVYGILIDEYEKVKVKMSNKQIEDLQKDLKAANEIFGKVIRSSDILVGNIIDTIKYILETIRKVQDIFHYCGKDSMEPQSLQLDSDLQNLFTAVLAQLNHILNFLETSLQPCLRRAMNLV